VFTILGMAQRTRLVDWNRKDLPPEFRDLPAGRYRVEVVDGEAPVLGPTKKPASRRPLSRTARSDSSRRSAPAK
jgi:hypothetical protein